MQGQERITERKDGKSSRNKLSINTRMSGDRYASWTIVPKKRLLQYKKPLVIL
jgi:hypothetical protein